MQINTHIWNEARSAWQGQEAAGQADLVLMAGQTAVQEDGAALAALQA